MSLGKHPVARVSAHPPIFAAELQAPMGAYPEEYGSVISSFELRKASRHCTMLVRKAR